MKNFHSSKDTTNSSCDNLYLYTILLHKYASKKKKNSKMRNKKYRILLSIACHGIRWLTWPERYHSPLPLDLSWKVGGRGRRREGIRIVESDGRIDRYSSSREETFITYRGIVFRVESLTVGKRHRGNLSFLPSWKGLLPRDSRYYYCTSSRDFSSRFLQRVCMIVSAVISFCVLEFIINLIIYIL